MRERLLYCDPIEDKGEALFSLACERDLEGIVAKRKGDPYLPEHATWLKIRNLLAVDRARGIIRCENAPAILLGNTGICVHF